MEHKLEDTISRDSSNYINQPHVYHALQPDIEWANRTIRRYFPVRFKKVRNELGKDQILKGVTQ